MDQRFGPPASDEQRLIMAQIQAEQERAAQDPELASVRQHVSGLQINAEPPQTLLLQGSPNQT